MTGKSSEPTFVNYKLKAVHHEQQTDGSSCGVWVLMVRYFSLS